MVLSQHVKLLHYGAQSIVVVRIDMDVAVSMFNSAVGERANLPQNRRRKHAARGFSTHVGHPGSLENFVLDQRRGERSPLRFEAFVFLVDVFVDGFHVFHI
jgi:hypothetical protein